MENNEKDNKKSTLLNLTSETKSDNNIIITPNENSRMFLSYLRDNINFTNEKDRKEFIVGTERIIRLSNDYKAYIAHLKTLPGSKTCALFNHITDDMAPLEMHHGPIFTLAEIVTITLNHFIKNGKEISSFKIADQVLEDHFDNLIQTIFLCKSAHAILSDKKINKDAFVSMDKVISGDIVGFITKYNDSITYYEVNKIRNYLYMSDLYSKNQGTSVYTFFKERVKGFKDAKPEDN